ncbi:DNA-3-methyladenine glycosylase family protein [Ktedonospora formicarum]|uniref:DNA-3-methyladenine glycosylase II n=1 Tax=Ktedonospora formicarum TaxID=2778364 RepID=A0A8J3MTU8_9CHLR|nr:DNA-3-methyladenine glycosylase [Ktedonospora formicarum]GHO44765.1 DNA-3-methyladenine glycosylase II [Ktedonospora formicarum]
MTTQKPFSDTIIEATTYLRHADPVLAQAIERVGPCTLMPDPNIFEALVDAIISQQISIPAADTIMGRLRRLVPENRIEPHTLLPLTHDDLRGVGLSNAKAHYIQSLLEHITSGQLHLETLDAYDDEEIIQQLCAVKGIGRWSAEMILVFCLGRPDVLPVDDLGFQEAVRQVYGLSERPKPRDLRMRGECWRPYRTFATWYLWAWKERLNGKHRPRTRIVSL